MPVLRSAVASGLTMLVPAYRFSLTYVLSSVHIRFGYDYFAIPVLRSAVANDLTVLCALRPLLRKMGVCNTRRNAIF